MKLISDNMETVTTIRLICMKIAENPSDIKSISELKKLLTNSSPTIVRATQSSILSAVYVILKKVSENHTNKFKIVERQIIVDALKSLFDKIIIDKLVIFYNLYGFLLFEIYDANKHIVFDVGEEYKMSIMSCMISIMKSISTSVILDLYTKENAPRLCQMIYVALEIAKTEQYKTLRIAAIQCIMALARILLDDDFDDVVIRNQIADVFMFFLPGIAVQLKSIALSDEKIGHKVPCEALKAWGRIVTLLMQDYKASDDKINLKMCKESGSVKLQTDKIWKNENELKEHLLKTERNVEWYKNADEKLALIIIELSKLTSHYHLKVKLELLNISALLIENCMSTMPTSLTNIVHIVITLSEDKDELIAGKSKEILETLSNKFTTEEFKGLFENLEEQFYNSIIAIPRKLNSIDEADQENALNIVIGYINVFNNHNLNRILHSTDHIKQLMSTLIHISEFDTSDISILEDFVTEDLDSTNKLPVISYKFRLFREDAIRGKIALICQLLGKYGDVAIVSDLLLNIIIQEAEHRKEAIFLLNELIVGMEIGNDEIFILIKSILCTYTETCHWNPPLAISTDEYEYTLGEIQNNIVQVCLLIEGIGKISQTCGKRFEQFLLKTLYIVLERAGSGHPIIRTVALLTLTKISIVCGYQNISQLINTNIDYFSFHVQRKLKRHNEKRGALYVLAVVMKHSTVEVLQTTSEIIRELLLQASVNKSEIEMNATLQVFKIFIQCLRKWLNIQIEPKVQFKTKEQKQQEFEHFKVSNFDEPLEDFADDIMHTSAEEMYKEDQLKSKKQLEDEMNQDDGYKKPEPPSHIKLTVTIINQCLHFLPSKNQCRQLIILEILKNGLAILKEWEDELLPIVHQIWNPLINRFKEMDKPLIINYSFQLLIEMARLSKDFIRSRTAKDVLPSLISTLDSYAKDSYLKDIGSAYRYTQKYKLQLLILKELAGVVMDLDLLQSDVDLALEVVFKYLNDKQPIPLQEAAREFTNTLKMYDPQVIEEKLNLLNSKNGFL